MNQAFIVKNSFLEEVDDASFAFPKTLKRSLSDSALYRFDECADDQDDEDIIDDKRSESTASTSDAPSRKASSFLWSEDDDLDDDFFGGDDSMVPASPPGVHFTSQAPPGVHQAPPGVHQAPPGVHQAPPGVHQAPPCVHFPVEDFWLPTNEVTVKRSGPPGCWSQPDGRARAFTDGCVEWTTPPTSARDRSLSEGCIADKLEEKPESQDGQQSTE